MKKFTRGRIRAFLAKHATTGLVLDIGAGGMNQDASFPNRTTFDIDPGRNPSIVGDIHKMPFADGSFDTILCTEVFEHLHSPEIAVREMLRVLRPGGTLLLTTRFLFPVHDAPHDYYRYTVYGLQHLFAGWDDVTIEAETGVFTAIAVLLQRIMFQTTLKGGKVTKAILYGLAFIFSYLDSLVITQYGDIGRSREEEILFTSGLYMAARKPY